MRLFDIIKKPIVTEKTSNASLLNNTYALDVSSDATKIDIKKAISYIYGVEVDSVRVLNTREKFKHSRKWLALKRRTSKKAYVTLKNASDKIDFSILK